MASADHDNVDELIAKHFAGETDIDEDTRLLLWVNRNEENKRHYAALRKTFDAATSHVAVPPSDQLDIDVDREWDVFKRKAGMTTRVVNISRSAILWRVAASLLIIATLAAIFFYFSGEAVTTVRTYASAETIRLPDGSRVTLNRESELTYGPDFDTNVRVVSLTGEAFFDVTPNAAKPFIIKTGDTRVNVVGTSFNVNAYDSMDVVEVVVETGVVSVQSSGAGKEPVRVKPGERAVISKSDQQISVDVNKDVNFRAWDTRHLVFVDNELMSVIRTLERTYNAEILVRTKLPPSCIVTVTFREQSLESVMRVLANTLNLTYTINRNRVEITEAGC